MLARDSSMLARDASVLVDASMLARDSSMLAHDSSPHALFSPFSPGPKRLWLLQLRLQLRRSLGYDLLLKVAARNLFAASRFIVGASLRSFGAMGVPKLPYGPYLSILKPLLLEALLGLVE